MTPGTPVLVESTEDGVLLRRALTKQEALDGLMGAIHAGNRRKDVEPLDPRDLKRLWDPTSRER